MKSAATFIFSHSGTVYHCRQWHKVQPKLRVWSPQRIHRPLKNSAFYFNLLLLFLTVSFYAAQVVLAESLSSTEYYTDQDASPEVSTQEFARLSEQADQGESEALCRLGTLYLHGWGTRTDPKIAWKLFQQAASSGNAEAMNKIGGMYEQGIYVEQNYAKALQWHLRSAILGYADGQSDAGRIYEDGLTSEMDTHTALHWYRKAAAQGEPFALEALQRLEAQQEKLFIHLPLFRRE